MDEELRVRHTPIISFIMRPGRYRLEKGGMLVLPVPSRSLAEKGGEGSLADIGIGAIDLVDS